jgi:hypothetical protein
VLEEVKMLIANNQAAVHHSVGSVGALATSLGRLSRRLESFAGGVPESGTGGSGDDLGAQFRDVVARLDAITARLEEGEGTLGALLAKTDTKDHLDRALVAAEESLSSFGRTMSWMNQTRASFGVRADYLAGRDAAKGYVMLEVRPPSPAFLRLELVSRPIVFTPTPPDADSIAFSATGGFRIGVGSFRAGLIESSPGGGADLWLLGDRIRLSGDIWELSRRDLRPHLRFEAAVIPLRWLELVGGWDEPLNAADDLSSFFLGASLRVSPE